MKPYAAIPVRREKASLPSAQGGRLGLCSLFLALLSLQVGCLQSQVNRDLYIRELRLQEDEIYRLEDCIEDYQGVIRGYRSEIDQLQEEIDQLRDERASLSEEIAPPATSERSLLDDPLEESEETRPFDAGSSQPAIDTAPQIDLPAIDLGEEFDPSSPPVPSSPPTKEAPLPFQPPSAMPESGPESRGDGVSDARSLDEAPLTVFSPQPIESLQILSQVGPEEPTGESTLLTSILPATASGEPALFDGEVSLMLRDPSTGPEGTKIARWDYSSREVAAAWRGLDGNSTLDFSLLLPNDTPLDRPLELWIRLVDETGLKTLVVEHLTMTELAPWNSRPLTKSEDSLDQSLPSGWRTANPALFEETIVSKGDADSGWRHASGSPPDRVELATYEGPLSPAPNSKAPKAWAPARGPRPRHSR